MKKLTILAMAMLCTTTFYSQSTFDAYDQHDDVNAIVVTKKMFELMGKVQIDGSDSVSQNYLNLTKKLTDLKVFTTQNAAREKEMKISAYNYIKSASLVELKKVNETGKTVTIYSNAGATANQVKELLMFIESSSNEDSVLMDLKGNFSLSEISLLIDKMQIPGGKYLKQVANGR